MFNIAIRHTPQYTHMEYIYNIYIYECMWVEHGTSYTEPLCVVTVPPRWLVEPSDVSVERNRHVALHCQAQGVPTPTVVWKKATGLAYIS